MRSAEEIKAEIEAVDRAVLRWAGKDQDRFEEYADRELALLHELEDTTVPVRREDVDSAIRALSRWARQCVPGADRALRETEARLRAALEQ